MKKLEAVFGKKINTEVIEVLKRAMQGLLDAISKGVPADKILSGFSDGLKQINSSLEITSQKAKEVKKSLAEIYQQEAGIYPKSVGKAAKFYDKSVASGVEKGGLTYSAAERQLAGFVQNLTYTGSK
jgi:hypothetical protein